MLWKPIAIVVFEFYLLFGVFSLPKNENILYKMFYLSLLVVSRVTSPIEYLMFRETS